MSANSLIKRLLDAGMQFTEMSQDKAEKIVKELVKSGQAKHKDSQHMVDELVARGREAGGSAFAQFQSEMSKQLGRFAGQLDELEGRVEEIAQKLGIVHKPAPVKKAAPAKKAAAKKAAPAKKAAAKKAAPAKKAAAKKAPAKKAAAKKAPAKKAAPAKQA